MNVAIYLRVSTDAQDTERQRADLVAWCGRQGHAITHCGSDKASGADTERHERRMLMDLARSGKYQAIVVSELSRWSRSTTDLLTTLETLAADGVRLIAINGPDFDIGKPLGKMMLTVLGAVAEFERGLIGERIRSGMAAKKARGEHVGRQQGSDVKVQAVRAALKRTNIDGMTDAAAARMLGCCRNTLKKALRAP